MIAKRDVLAGFRLNDGAMRLNLEGITDGESLYSEDGKLNSILWMVGHLTWVRLEHLEKLGYSARGFDENTKAYFAQGHDLASAQAPPMSFEEVLDSWNRVARDLEHAYEEIEEGMVYISGQPPQMEGVGLLLFHEAYHIGQIGMMRKLLGKGGAIR